MNKAEQSSRGWWARENVQARAHFYGTSREPVLRAATSDTGKPVLRPHYDLIHQTSLDVQYTVDAWLLKLEAMTRSGRAIASLGPSVASSTPSSA